MNLIIFDIDGTLTSTNELDNICFLKMVKHQLDLHDFNMDWNIYRYSTNSGIIQEIYEKILGRLPQNHEITQLQQTFMQHIQQNYDLDPKHIQPIPGAENIFSHIHSLGNWHIGIATGGWKNSALFKLDKAHILHHDIPKAYADDHIERSQIIKKTIQLAKEYHGISKYEKIIYTGDGSWDAKAAMLLNISFIGVGKQFHSQKDYFYINDYLDTNYFLNCLIDL